MCDACFILFAVVSYAKFTMSLSALRIRGITLTLLTGDGTLVKSRERVLSLCADVFTVVPIIS